MEKMMPTLDELQRRSDDFLKNGPGGGGVLGLAPAPTERFSPFVPEQVARAIALVDRFMSLTSGKGNEDALQTVLDEAHTAAQTEPLDLVRYALMVFLTHNPVGINLQIPALEERAPEKVLPSRSAPSATLGVGETQAEADLNWFREDAWANDHHDHWHIVYPTRGVPDGNGNKTLKKRAGELFLYMHQQMLARYDTERLALGLAPVVPLSDFGQPIPEGYDPSPDIGLQTDPNSSTSEYSPREPDLRLADLHRQDIGNYPVSELENSVTRLNDAIQRGTFQDGPHHAAITPDLLGATIEPTNDSFSQQLFGNHHGMGHVLLSVINDPQGNAAPGVMYYTEAAIRDPVFYRWHRHVDDFSFRWQEQQPPNDWSDAPNVVIRNAGDIILCFRDQIPGAQAHSFNGQSYGTKTFGGAQWDTDFSSGGVTTATLETSMLQRPITLRDGTTAQIPYLDQREFFYFLRVENRAAQETDVTVRIFLVAKHVAEERRMWIEMDKFRSTLPASKRTVIFRPAALSSVIRKPAVKPPVPVREHADLPNDPESYCNCGWPYNLLLPRGTAAGMEFRLMVLLTDWQIDKVEDNKSCGSMSFCGKRDSGYPDTRAMGYPFDRPFGATDAIAQTITSHDNMAARDITIRCTNL
ncbi:MAG: hypothetical protein H0X37_19705 [Herpetosiphonaceae bacterium]|nr:hypothetical protein [Herpetosiphonaceae bacterium]